MKKYLVIKTNHGFRGRMWEEGKIVEFPDDVVPNKHFELITKKTILPKDTDNTIMPPSSLSGMQAQTRKVEQTAGAALKDDKGIATKPLSESELQAISELDETGMQSAGTSQQTEEM